MHLLVEVEKTQLEVDLMSPRMVQLWRPWVLGSSYEKVKSLYFKILPEKTSIGSGKRKKKRNGELIKSQQ